jgi:hypothetical protein
MISRIRKINGRIVWKLGNDHASVETVIARDEDIVEFLELLRNYSLSDGPDWRKFEGGVYHYCLTMDYPKHTFCIFNAFDNKHHDYCASINFSEADRSVMIKSLRKYLSKQTEVHMEEDKGSL